MDKLFGRIYKSLSNKWSYIKLHSLAYSDELRKAYSSGSVVEGKLKGKRVMITGATGGIGIALVNRFLQEGCQLVLVGRDEQKLKNLINKMNNSDIEYIVVDQSDEKNINNQVMNIRNIDILINNAGIYTEYDRNKKFRNVTEEVYNKILNINLKSVILITQQVIEDMINRNKEGYIINISSVCGLYKEFQYTPYGISKSSLIGYTEKMSELYKSKKIIFNTIAPGSVATRMGNYAIDDNISKANTSVRRVVLPEEVAALSARLSTNVGKYFNGKVIKLCANEKF